MEAIWMFEEWTSCILDVERIIDEYLESKAVKVIGRSSYVSFRPILTTQCFGKGIFISVDTKTASTKKGIARCSYVQVDDIVEKMLSPFSVSTTAIDGISVTMIIERDVYPWHELEFSRVTVFLSSHGVALVKRSFDLLISEATDIDSIAMEDNTLFIRLKAPAVGIFQIWL